MSVPRQGGDLDHGRVNQKQRTRAAVVTAARDLLAGGVTPTVAQAAEAALVSRTTAYRYFPTQEALLVEVAMNQDVSEIEDLVATPVDAEGAGQRVLDVLGVFSRHVFAAEAQYRTALRLYLERWLEVSATGDEAPVVREGRRQRWIEQSLAPLRTTVDPAAWDRLVAGLCLLGGGEALVVLRDVCGLEPDDARAVLAWAGETLLRETFGDVLT